jgi:DNA-binding IclR family transcriptional regulator
MPSTLRCIRVLELLAEDPYELTLRGIADRLGIPKSSAHRLCATLLESGMIEQDSRTSHYVLAAKALWVGSGYLWRLPLYRAAFFPMQELAQHAPGTVQLGVRLGDRVLFIHSIGHAGAPQAFAHVGLRRPFHATASGKVFLAAMPPGEVKRLFEAGFERYTNRTIVALEQMERELDEVRLKKYARAVEELLPGFSVLAAPVTGSGGETTAAISVTLATEFLLRPGKEAHCVGLIQDACRRVSLQLGFSPAPASA